MQHRLCCVVYQYKCLIRRFLATVSGANASGKTDGYRVVGMYNMKAISGTDDMLEEFSAVPVNWLRVMNQEIVLCLWPKGASGRNLKTLTEAPAPQSTWDVYCVFKSSSSKVFSSYKVADEFCEKYCLDAKCLYSSCTEDEDAHPDDEDDSQACGARVGSGTRLGGRPPAEGSYQASIVPSDIGLNDSDAPTEKPVCSS